MTKISICWSSVVLYQTWPTFAYTNLLMQSSIHSRKETKDLLEKIREDVVGGSYIVFTRKAVADETFIRKSTNFCKSIVGIDASQLYPYSMCQPMPTGLYTRWDFDSETRRFIPRQNKTRSFENMVMSFFQRTRPECEIESFFTTGRQKKIDCFSVNGFCSHCNTVFEAMGCFYHFCPCQELHPSLTEEDIQCCSKRSFPYRRSIAAEQLLEEIKKEKLFGYVQCDIEVPENLRPTIITFPAIFNNTLVSKSNIGDLMKNFAEEERLLSQPRKMLISSFTLQDGTLITPLLLFYLKLGLLCTKIHRFVENTPKKYLNSFVQSAVDARTQCDENPNSSVVAETMKLLANSSHGYQIMDRSRHTVTKYLTDEKTHVASSSKLFKKLDHVNNSL